MPTITKCLKKIFKCMLIFIAGVIGLIVLLAGITVINTTWHTDKFRFENFKTGQELREYINTHYPKGSDGQPLIDLLKSAGADCELIPEEYYSKEVKEVGTYFRYQCLYSAGWLYWPTLTGYGVWLSLDKDRKLIESAAGIQYRGL